MKESDEDQAFADMAETECVVEKTKKYDPEASGDANLKVVFFPRFKNGSFTSSFSGRVAKSPIAESLRKASRPNFRHSEVMIRQSAVLPNAWRIYIKFVMTIRVHSPPLHWRHGNA